MEINQEYYDIKHYMPNWRDYSPLKIVNETGLLPCGFCGMIIYKKREDGKQFSSENIINSHDFTGVNGFPDPVEYTEMICPNCQGPMLLRNENN